MPLIAEAADVQMTTGCQECLTTTPRSNWGKADPKQKAPNMMPMAVPRSFAENQVDNNLTPGGYTSERKAPTRKRQNNAP
mmetsp:Transcript_143203/g.399185  ORF Transcript_143203/g.399185 Transcript_143203/m.399185 type:complete len:80 (-) Transcript_143203:450-689(-)